MDRDCIVLRRCLDRHSLWSPNLCPKKLLVGCGTDLSLGNHLRHLSRWQRGVNSQAGRVGIYLLRHDRVVDLRLCSLLADDRAIDVA